MSHESYRNTTEFKTPSTFGRSKYPKSSAKYGYKFDLDTCCPPISPSGIKSWDRVLFHNVKSNPEQDAQAPILSVTNSNTVLTLSSALRNLCQSGDIADLQNFAQNLNNALASAEAGTCVTVNNVSNQPLTNDQTVQESVNSECPILTLNIGLFDRQFLFADRTVQVGRSQITAREDFFQFQIIPNPTYQITGVNLFVSNQIPEILAPGQADISLKFNNANTANFNVLYSQLQEINGFNPNELSYIAINVQLRRFVGLQSLTLAQLRELETVLPENPIRVITDRGIIISAPEAPYLLRKRFYNLNSGTNDIGAFVSVQSTYSEANQSEVFNQINYLFNTFPIGSQTSFGLITPNVLSTAVLVLTGSSQQISEIAINAQLNGSDYRPLSVTDSIALLLKNESGTIMAVVPVPIEQIDPSIVQQPIYLNTQGWMLASDDGIATPGCTANRGVPWAQYFRYNIIFPSE